MANFIIGFVVGMLFMTFLISYCLIAGSEREYTDFLNKMEEIRFNYRHK